MSNNYLLRPLNLSGIFSLQTPPLSDRFQELTLYEIEYLFLHQTGDMEVKNPLFSEDPTPATPGKCELVKPQPKD